MKRWNSKRELAYQGIYDLGAQLQSLALGYQDVIEENIRLKEELRLREEKDYEYVKSSTNEIFNVLNAVYVNSKDER